MFKNYLLVAIRNLLKHKVYSLINLTSLSVGIATCIVIFVFLSYETSFDNFHKKGANIYRLDEVQSFPGTDVQKVALSMSAMGPHLVNDLPEVKNYTRFWGWGKEIFKYNDHQLLVDKTVAVDSTFLEIFDFEMISGDRSTALDLPNSLVITEKIAKAIFNNEDPINQTLRFTRRGEEVEGKVTGLLKNIPENSHLQFDMLVSMTTVTSRNQEFNDQWGNNFLVTYLLLEDYYVDFQALESKFAAFMVSKMGEDIGDYYKLYVQPLSDVHLGSVDMDHDYHNWGEFDRSYVNVFTIMAIFVLIIASINFMNLSTARSVIRSKEVGLRKAIGAGKVQIVNQFLGESILLAFVALGIGLLLAVIFIPLLNQITLRPLSLTSNLQNVNFVTGLVAGTIIIGTLSGLYPSFVMSSFNPVKALKGRISSSSGKNNLQNLLVVAQFTVAITLIVSTLIAINQFNFMKDKDPGFNKEQMVLVPLSRNANDNFETLKNELRSQSGVEGVTAAGQRIGNNFHQWGFKFKSDTGVNTITVSNVNVDYDYFEVYQIPIKNGRAFSKEHSTDPNFSFIVNEAFLKELNITDPIGMSAGHGNYHEDSLGSIIGVTGDFNFNSLHHKVNTLVVSLHPEWGYDELSIKIAPENMQQTISNIENTWKKIVTDRPFEYSFLDQHFDSLYAADEQMSKVVPIIAILAVIIAAMGLFGLSSITIEQRIKEIGIRKVLGASIMELFSLVSKKFALMVFIAFLLSIPLSFYAMSDWLTNFAYHIDINFLVYVVTGILTLLIALITISFRTISAALKNPTETLKYE